MQRKGFDILRDSEDSWWYVGRSLVASRIMEKYCRQTGEHILDFGSGYGGMFATLSRFGTVSACEPNDEARAVSASRGYSKVFSGVDDAFTDAGAFTTIALFDVVEHIEDDRGFIERAYKNLSHEGQLIITVPAFQWLWSEHDVHHSHFRRYSKKELTAVVKACGFVIEYAGYWNFFLSPLAFGVRLFGNSGSGSFSMPSLLNRIFLFFVRLESLLIPLFRLPFGTSVLLVAKKK